MSKTLLEVLEEVITRHPALGRKDYLSGAADASEFQASSFIGFAAGDLVLPGAHPYQWPRGEKASPPRAASLCAIAARHLG